MGSTKHSIVRANGLSLHVAEQGSGPLVLLVHGFPECWYSWRHTLPAIAAAGRRAVAIDVRGYARSEAPAAIDAYRMTELVADVVGVIDALGERDAVLVGHDWGAPIAYHTALLHPDRVRAVVGLSVPFTPRSQKPPTVRLRERVGDVYFYMLHFQDPGVAETELDADVRRSLRLFLYAASGEGMNLGAFVGKPKGANVLDGMVDPAPFPSWLSDEELDVFAGEMARRGFFGGLCRYRNMDRDFADLPQLAGAKLPQPMLFVAGDRDLTLALNQSAVESMKVHVPDLRRSLILPGAGHWIQQERPVETNRAIVEFLRELE
jgi:pimeloyl-ACP methyl ester carboxylesterase